MDVAHQPDDSPASPQGQVDAILVLLRATQTLRRSLQTRLARLNADENTWFLLAACRATSGVGPTQIELARRIGISPAQVSVLVEQLRVAGWIETIRSAADRRRQCCRTTASGEDRLLALTQTVLPVIDAWRDALADDWMATLDSVSNSEIADDEKNASTPFDKPADLTSRRRAA